MAKNKVFDPGDNLTVVVDNPAAPNSGDPVRVGVMTGVAMVDEGEGALESDETVVDFGPGVYDLVVDDNEGSGISPGDTIYYHDTETGDPETNLNNSSTGADATFGVAMESVAANGTATIQVKHIPTAV